MSHPVETDSDTHDARPTGTRVFEASIPDHYRVFVFQGGDGRALSSVPDDAQSLVLWDTDSERPVKHLQHALVYRTSLRRSKRRPNEHVLPAHLSYSFSSTFSYETSAPLPPRFDTTPSVGFCGLLNRPRSKTLRALSRSPAIRCDFIARKQFFKNLPALTDAQREYERNMSDNAFIVCTRGAGNWSIRLYETMCAGRIPVVLDTDCQFPLEHEIPWSELCVIERKPADLAATVAAWNARGEAFVHDLQGRIFQTWHDKLRAPVFFQFLQSRAR